MKSDSMIRLRVLLGFIVYSASLGTTKHSQNICPGCYRCETDHRIFNGTTVEFVTALCHFRAGVKMTSIPQNLPSRLSTLTMTSQNIRELETSSLRKYPFLHILCLDRNGLQTIQNGSFSRQQFLTELDLKENELLEISAETFRGLKSLTKLRLDHNKLQRISRATFATVSLIKELDLRANRIIELEEGAFDKLDYLETILLSSNQLRSLNSGVLGNLMSLTRLELASNQITGIDEGTFGCAPILKRLVLKGNRMEKIPKESITHLRFLNNLDISENPVSFVGSDDLIGLKSLKTMYLNDCNISWIQDNAFYRLQEPITIHLKNNPLNCNCHLSWLPRFLLRKTNLTLSGAVCQAPRDISGQNIASANVQSFVCTCADCTCDQQPTNCSCAKNWIGLFCSDNCQSYNVSLSMCSKFGDKCFCGKSATLEKTAKSSNCSFNVTSTNCSDHGEVKKDGAHLKCVCKPGFTGNGLVCSDVDECVTAKGCPYYEHADCINTLGSYHCKCRKGFRHSAPLFCEDIDECEESQPCDKHANCHNSKGKNSLMRAQVRN